MKNTMAARIAALREMTVADLREKYHEVYKHEGVTTGRAKLIHFYPLNEWELYDLEADPHELNNVYGRSDYALLQSELTVELQRLRTELQVPPPK